MQKNSIKNNQTVHVSEDPPAVVVSDDRSDDLQDTATAFDFKSLRNFKSTKALMQINEQKLHFIKNKFLLLKKCMISDVICLQAELHTKLKRLAKINSKK